MFLAENYTTRIHKPGAIHHAHFMGKALYYLKLALFLKSTVPVLELEPNVVQEIEKMAVFVAVFYSSHFLTAEKSDAAALQVNISYTLTIIYSLNLKKNSVCTN